MELHFKGNQDLLNQNPLAVFCSRAIPLPIYYPAMDLMDALMEKPITFAGGWQSTVEKKALKTWKIEQPSNIIYFLGKGIDRFSPSAALRSGIAEGKALVLSEWKTAERMDRDKVVIRNWLIVERINRLLFLCIREGGFTEKLFNESVLLGKRLYLLDQPSNDRWMHPGVQMVSKNDFGILL
jgi:hypothetical protein